MLFNLQLKESMAATELMKIDKLFLQNLLADLPDEQVATRFCRKYSKATVSFVSEMAKISL